ncbi:phosphoglycolate phosphatase [Sphingomonas naasensis]|uniref:HAD family hydrolase n=1 Tax=Sphingomonas naasensis TaxID=1344951 RepID=A0A4S1WGS9_9SPHN|nr:HAD hydrolase-like protein [Sphingomonas naasensis]NIJ21597.1 phosphoglycolate phosphatase [Sphingomonas naasensis]TGX41465.1 HAD family hydrolase [Sphingomonas naasensis]
MADTGPETGNAVAPIRLVIFDFDGTLSDSGDWFLSVVDDLARKFRFRTVQPDEVEMLRHRSSREVINFLGIARWKMPLIARHLRKLVGRNAHRIELFPGTPDLLEQLAATGVRIALVTSNSEANARKILGEQHAARIDFYACGSSLFGKAPKFRRVLKKMGIPAGAALAIGDETRDIDAAREVGMRAGSVLWGYASEKVLVAHAPDTLFREPQDIVAYVAAHRS